MERQVALKKLRRILGKDMGYRINAKAPSRGEREDARAALPAAIAARKEAADKRDARYKALLEGDAEFQALKAEYQRAADHADHISSITRHFKITVGTITSIFFRVQAEGDTWEEIIAKLEKAGTK